ncbi:MAG TPA: hypothetical protein VNW53_04170 [Phenylobacterium sp.]|jgi:hypothetical protein|uniref:hypothetical protein n=1 Tax=Phenylobacterium sp. TaxID=1871053 RepID=UPI002CEA3C33|nr:hypothetical protein [Phenylobacterium sp.]HXA38172.1 hypothetical protein [Phenylobacterium sp.]
MKFEVVEGAEAWVVRRGGVELGRYADQAWAPADIGARLRDQEADAAPSYSLAVRYLMRG